MYLSLMYVVHVWEYPHIKWLESDRERERDFNILYISLLCLCTGD